MAGFQPTQIQVKMTSGIDTKSDSKSLQTKLTVLQNASFQNPGEISKRDGFTALPSPSSGAGIGTFKNELISLDGQNLYSYSPETNSQINHGTMVPTQLSVFSVIKNVNQQSNPDSAYDPATKLYLFTWLDSGSAEVNYSIIDSNTGTIIVNNKIAAPAIVAKPILLGTNFIVLYVNGGTNNICYKAINTSTPTSLGSEVVIAAVDSSQPQFDATIINGSIYVAYVKSSTAIGINSLSQLLILSSQYSVTTTGTANVISIVGDASFNVWISYGTVAFGGGGIPNGNVYSFIVNSALNSTLLAVTLIDSALNASNITQVVNATTMTIYYEYSYINSTVIDTSAIIDQANFIKKNTITFSGTVGTASVIMRGVGLSSKVFAQNGQIYFLVVYAGQYYFNSTTDSYVLKTIEPTYFLINGSGQTIAKIAPSLSGSYYLSGCLPEILKPSSGSFSFPYLLQGNLSSLEGIIFFQTGIQNASINFNVSSSIPKVQAGNNLLLAGGQMWNYDGANINEQGFHIYPENLYTNFAVSPAGGIGYGSATTVPAQYLYCSIYEEIDNQGQLNRSAVSPTISAFIPAYSSLAPISFTGGPQGTDAATGLGFINSPSSFSGLFIGQVITCTSTPTDVPAGTAIIAIDVANSRLLLNGPLPADSTPQTYSTSDVLSMNVRIPTLKQTLKQNVSIVVYRTTNNGSIFYRVSSLTSQIANDPTVDYITFSDTTGDAAIIGNEQLYTTGGVVSNYNPPAVSDIAIFKNRVIYLSPENQNQWGYSQQNVTGVPVEFNSLEFVENIDQSISLANVVHKMDDKLILFGPTSKFYVVGTGPSPNGTSNDFSDAIPIVGTTGCSNPASIVELPIGIIYQDSQKGIWLLERSLQESYVGADVEEFNSIPITSAQIFENHNKVIFTLQNGVSLVYDYYLQQWETDVFSTQAIDSTIFQNNFVYIQPNGLILQQTPGTYSDNGSIIPIQLQTAWMDFTGLEGFGRVWEMQIMGTYFSPHTLTVTIYTDFNSTANEVHTIPVLTAPQNGYKFRIKILTQKCTSMMVNITESQSGSPGEGFSLSSIAFRVGVKKGLNKLPAGASF